MILASDLPLLYTTTDNIPAYVVKKVALVLIAPLKHFSIVVYV